MKISKFLSSIMSFLDRVRFRRQILILQNQVIALKTDNLELDYAKNFYYKESYNMKLQLEVMRDINKSGSHSKLIDFLFEHHEKSKSQLLQDIVAAFLFKDKDFAFFVEFGAADGMELSNTYFLEKSLKWRGLLAEPSRSWHQQLQQNRNCQIDFRCVWSQSREILDFQETSDLMLSTVKDFIPSDLLAPFRVAGNTYQVESVSLKDLLIESKAPKYIEFLSIDTEGSEFQILKSFDFDLFTFGAIVVEHNFTPSRIPIRELLVSKGYLLFLENLTKWDDWYISPETYRKYHDLELSRSIPNKENLQ